MEIHLGKGVDILRFGMTQTEVEQLLGKPSRVQIDIDDDIQLVWQYNDQKLRLTFYQNEANRLGYIRSTNSKLTIKNVEIIDMKIEDVINHINPNPKSWETDEYDFFSTYFLESVWLTLHVEYDRVTGIELGVPFKNDDEYDWPE